MTEKQAPKGQVPLRAVRTVAKCPICSKDAAELKYRPFCGKRCADIDLGRWLKESYRVPAEEGPAEGESRGEDPGSPRERREQD